MNRSLSMAVAVLVAVVTFAWLAGPILERALGWQALLVTYGAVAGATGLTTYVLFRRFGRAPEADSERDQLDADIDAAIDEQEIEHEVAVIEREVETGDQE